MKINGFSSFEHECMSEKLLIIHMDDIGGSYAANMAAADLFEKGIASSGSVMMPCAWAFDFILWCNRNPQYDIGIHLTHTCEWDACRWRPLLDRRDVNKLADREGFMWRGFSGEMKSVGVEEYWAEMEIQMEQALAWGLRPTHIDSHMGVNMNSAEFFDAYLQIARKYGVIPNILHKEMLNNQIEMIIAKYGFRTIDACVSSGRGESYHDKKEDLYRELQNVKPGLNYLCIHPVYDTPEIRFIMPCWQERVLEYKLFMDDDTSKALQQLNIKVITWRDMEACVRCS